MRPVKGAKPRKKLNVKISSRFEKFKYIIFNILPAKTLSVKI